MSTAGPRPLPGWKLFSRLTPKAAPNTIPGWASCATNPDSGRSANRPIARPSNSLPAVDYLHNNLGYNLLMQKKNEEAAAEFQEALKLNPGSQMARNNLGIALAQSNATAQAVANWQSTSDPATAHNNLAAVWMEKGNYSEARRELDVALSYNRAHPAAIRNLELVSRLDGSPATLRRRRSMPLDTRWQRFRIGLRRLFVGPLDDSRTEAPKSASAQ